MNIAITYVYFDYRDRDQQSPEHIIASLLRQLLNYKLELPQLVKTMYQRYSPQQKRPSLEDLENLFRCACEMFEKVYVIIDALDECDEKRNRKCFLQFLTLQSSTRPSPRMLITSRPHPQDIKTALAAAASILVEASDSDVRRYLAHTIEVDGDLDIIDDSFKNEMVEVIATGAQGM